MKRRDHIHQPNELFIGSFVEITARYYPEELDDEQRELLKQLIDSFLKMGDPENLRQKAKPASLPEESLQNHRNDGM